LQQDAEVLKIAVLCFWCGIQYGISYIQKDLIKIWFHRFETVTISETLRN